MVQPLLPEYMTMGSDGMGTMGDMGMRVPPNSIPMVGGRGPFDSITMGGMFTILKVRPGITSYEDPGWYDHPKGSVAGRAAVDSLRRDGVSADGGSAPRAPRSKRAASPKAVTSTKKSGEASTAATVYSCVMHPDFTSPKPGRCPRCGMVLQRR